MGSAIVGRELTMPMHTDRRELIGCDTKALAAGDGQHYAIANFVNGFMMHPDKLLNAIASY